MASQTLRTTSLAVGMALLTGYAIEANAWRDDIQTSGPIENTITYYPYYRKVRYPLDPVYGLDPLTGYQFGTV